MDKNELAKKYGIDLAHLEQEQAKLAKNLIIKDAVDFSSFNRIAAIENLIVKNQIISAIILCDADFEIIEQEYFLDKLRFPYIREFKDYRELPAMVAALHKLKENPDIVLIKGDGINHPRLGLASHFSLLTGIPTIGVDDGFYEGNVSEKDNLMMNGKKAGKILISKQGSRPLYVCPGDKISIKTAKDLIIKMVVQPHKFPEPMHLAHKYAKDIQNELKLK